MGGRPVRRWTSPETAAQRCSRIDANIVEYAYIHHGSSPGGCHFRAVLAGCDVDVREWGAPLVRVCGCDGIQPQGLRAGDVVVAARRRRQGQRRQAPRDVAARDERYPAVSGGEPDRKITQPSLLTMQRYSVVGRRIGDYLAMSSAAAGCSTAGCPAAGVAAAWSAW